MQILLRGRLPGGFFVQLVLAGLIGWAVALTDTTSARATESNSIAGWWIAVDEWWPMIWEGAGIRPMEELLIVAADGHVENRLMLLDAPHGESCIASGNCSDAPIVAKARIVMTDSRLEFADRVEGTFSFYPDEPELNRRYRSLAVTGRASWNYALRESDKVLTLQAGNAGLTRTFARIEADRLRRLRAGLIVAGVAAYEHWRCYLANATVDDPAFEVMSADRRHAPDDLDDFLKAASYGIALHDASLRPVPDDPGPARRALAKVPLERIMIEAFESIRPPTTLAERKALEDRMQAFNAQLQGAPPQADIPLNKAELAALARMLALGEEAQDLFCLEP